MEYSDSTIYENKGLSKEWNGMKLDNYIEQIRSHIKEYLLKKFQDVEVLIQKRRKK